MAKYHSSAFGNIEGEALGVVAARNKAGNYIKKKTKATDPRTAEQVNRRTGYKAFCEFWNTIYFDPDLPIKYFKKGKLSLFSSALSWALDNTVDGDQLYATIFPFGGTMQAPRLSYTVKDYGIPTLARISMNVDAAPYQYLPDAVLYLVGVGMLGGGPFPNTFVVRKYNEYKIAEVPQTWSQYLFVASEGAAPEPGNTYYLFVFDKKSKRMSKPAALRALSPTEVELTYPLGK